ncbi:MAG: GNAT family N-acetyltransferase [Blastocatellia bacterium]
MENNLVIRPCTTLAEFADCIALQQAVWGDEDRELVPQHIFVVANKTGGQVLGAYDGERLVGYLLAMVGLRNGHLHLHSHMTGVHPDYQNCGIGRRLKLAQREDAIARGFDLIEWTFDPLKLRNAFFNIVRLGAIIRTYLPNVYGQTTSHLDRGLPTDRFLAEWWITTPRVQTILAGAPYLPATNCERVFVPSEGQTVEVQTALQARFQQLFAEGYAVTGLERKAAGIEYLLEL